MNFVSEQFPNASLMFKEGYLYMRVSLNIKPELRKFLRGNVEKGEKMYVYALKKKIIDTSEAHIKGIYNILLQRCMVNIREAKKKQLDVEIRKIKNRKK